MSARSPFGFVQFLAMLIIAGLTGACGLGPYKELEAPPVITNVPVDASAFLSALNQYRQANGQRALKADSTLTEVSQAMARHIAERDSMQTWQHSGFSLAQRLEKAGYKNYAGAENLGAGYADWQAAFAGWQGSEGHNKNLLNPYVTRAGIARTNRSDGTWRNFWVVTFARPAADGRPSAR